LNQALFGLGITVDFERNEGRANNGIQRSKLVVGCGIFAADSVQILLQRPQNSLTCAPADARQQGRARLSLIASVLALLPENSSRLVIIDRPQ